MRRPVSADDFRHTLALFASGVTVVTTELDGQLHGMTANAFTSVSLEPPLVLVCVDHSAYLNVLLPRSRRFCATILADDQDEVSVWFAAPRPQGAEFDDVDWKPAPATGCPVLTRGLAYVDCEVRDVHTAGDHDIYVAEVVDVGLLSGGDPLLYYRSAYRGIGPARD